MAFTLSFIVSQGVDSTIATLTDTTTGSDGAIVGRRIYITNSAGTPVIPVGTTTTYIDFPFSDGASKVLNVLPYDYALSISLRYVDVNGTALYSLSQNYAFTGNDNDFDYSLTQQLAANPDLMRNNDYVTNRLTLRMLIDAASEAVTTGNDITGSQFCLDLAQDYVNHQNRYF